MCNSASVGAQPSATGTRAPAPHNYYDSHVAALEDIEVPAGRFRVFRIESRGDAVGAKSVWRLSRSDWLDPVTMKGVQHKYRSTSADGSKVFDDYTEVLVSLRLVPRT